MSLKMPIVIGAVSLKDEPCPLFLTDRTALLSLHMAYWRLPAPIITTRHSRGNVFVIGHVWQLTKCVRIVLHCLKGTRTLYVQPVTEWYTQRRLRCVCAKRLCGNTNSTVFKKVKCK
jgi:hypothetical protein